MAFDWDEQIKQQVEAFNRKLMTPNPTLGYANAGLIPGEYNPEVADDVTINAKKGEYIFAPEVVQYYGTQKLEQMQMKAKESLGLPQETGPKMGNEPDSMGRMDMPGLPQMQGMADGGLKTGDDEEYPLTDAFNATPSDTPLKSASVTMPMPSRPAGIQPYTPALVPEELREDQSPANDAAATITTNNNAGTGLIRFNDTGKQISMDSAGLTTADRGFADDVSPMLPASATMDNLVDSQAEKLNNERYLEKMNRMGTEYTYGSDGTAIRIGNVELTPENSINGKHISELLGANPTPETRAKVVGLFRSRDEGDRAKVLNDSVVAENKAQAGFYDARAKEQAGLTTAAIDRAANMGRGRIGINQTPESAQSWIAAVENGAVKTLSQIPRQDRSNVINEINKSRPDLLAKLNDIMGTATFNQNAGVMNTKALLNTIDPLLDEVVTAGGLLNNSNIPIYNKAKNFLSEQMGDASIVGFNNLRDDVVAEVERGLLGSGVLSDSKYQRAMKNVNSAQSPEQLRAAVDNIKVVIRARLEALDAGPNAPIPGKGTGLHSGGGQAGKPSGLDHFLIEARKVNPGMSDAEITAEYNKRYGGK